MSNCTRPYPIVPPGLCEPCPHCRANRFPDTDTREPVCAACVFVVPVGDGDHDEPRLTRDEAFEKVRHLLRWHAVRFIRAERAGYGTTAEEFVAEATVWFCRSWHTFDGNPGHLNTFARWASQHAAKKLRRQNRAALGVSLDAFEHPADLAAAPEPARGLEPDELDRLRAALAELPDRQRDEVTRYFGIGRHREHSARDLTQRWGSGGRHAAGARIKNALNRLAARLTND